MMSPTTFWSLAVIVIGSSLLVVSLRNIFHAGLALIVTFVGVAGYYLALRSDFLAVTQILIYAGAIAVLILFAILMTHKVGDEKRVETHNSLKVMCLLVIMPLFGIIATAIIATFSLKDFAGELISPGLSKIGERLLQAHALPFEIISVILLAAIIGAIVVGREGEKEKNR